MSKLYQRLDSPHFDYRLSTVPGAGEQLFRGPVPDLDAPFIAFIGGAQTFGRFVPETFADLLGQRLAMPVLNLSIGGAGPRFGLLPPIRRILARARLVVVQFYSGRSTSNSLIDNSKSGRNSGIERATGKERPTEAVFAEVFKTGDQAYIAKIVREMREDYIAAMNEFARVIGVPAVALWFSRRKPDYVTEYGDMFGINNLFPQLLDREVVDRVRPQLAGYVECITKVGIPQRLWRASEAVEGTLLGGDGWLWNEYYPSPEMHRAAAEQLEPVLRRLLAEPAKR